MKKLLILLLAVCLLCSLAGCSASGSLALHMLEQAQRRTSQRPEAKASVSPIPDKEHFLALHNEAAEYLGGELIDPDKTEPLAWGEGDPIEGGFLYDGYTNGYAVGVLMFEPDYIRITGRVSDWELSILEYAAVAVGVTGGEAEEALEAMQRLADDAELTTRGNGYKYYDGRIQYEGVTFTIEISKDDDMVQFWVNPDGLQASIQKNS